MKHLTLDPDGLYVFVDDTGHEKLAGDQPYYGVGGCAVMGCDYERLIAGPWSVVRLLKTGDHKKPLHAAEFGRTATQAQFDALTRFFADNRFMRVGVAGAKTTIVPEGIPLMRHVLELLKRRIVDVAQWVPRKSVTVIFEQNPRADRLVLEYFDDVRFRVNQKEIPTNVYFLRKSANDPALEVADFIANAVGGNALQTLINRDFTPRKDFSAIFHSVDKRLISYMGIEKAEIVPPPVAPTAT